MKKLQIFIILILTQLIFSAGTTTGVFLQLPIGGKPSAMGNAYTSISQDIYSINFNPAGLAEIQQIKIALQHCEYLQDMRYEHISVIFPIKQAYLGVAGVSLFGLYSNSIERTYLLGASDYEKDGTFRTIDLMGVFSWGATLMQNIYIGTNLKIIRSQLETESATAVAADFGTIYKKRFILPFQAGITLRNVGTGLKYINTSNPIPTSIKAGISTQYAFNNYIQMLISCDAGMTRGSNFEFSSGMDFTLFEDYSIRCGYNNLTDIGTGISTGFGIQYNSWTLDYSINFYNYIGINHRLNLIYTL